MENKSLVSVVTPTHNRCQLLKETVASIFAQTFTNWELIVVDDASADETWAWLQGLHDPRVKKIRLEQHAERAKARNVGLEAAQGQFVLFVDDDDLLAPRALQTHVEALERQSAAIASIGSYVMFDERGSRRTSRIVRRGMVRHIWQDMLFGWMAISGQCLFRTQAIKSVHGWNEAYNIAEDHDLWLRVGRLGPAALLPDVVLSYRVHSGQWRPRNLERLMTEIREQAVRQLQGSERERAERILQARELERSAFAHFLRSEAGKALMAYCQALQIMPNLLRSPLTRPLVVRPMLKCLVGSIGIRLGRPLLSLLWRLQKRDIKSSVRIVD